MELKIKKLSDKAIMPIRAHNSDAGLDLTTTSITSEINECGQFILVYHSDIAVEIPDGYVGLLFPRSSIAKKSIQFTNAVGVIDSGYRGEIMAKVRNTSCDSIPAVYKVGEKFAQLVIVPYVSDITISEVSELQESDRGTSGYGSSDTKEDISAAKQSDASEDKQAVEVETSETAA
mgnify:FL=1